MTNRTNRALSSVRHWSAGLLLASALATGGLGVHLAQGYASNPPQTAAAAAPTTGASAAAASGASSGSSASGSSFGAAGAVSGSSRSAPATTTRGS